MIIRKITRWLLVVLVCFGAIGGIGTLFGKHKKSTPVVTQTPSYTAEKAFASAFATMYLGITPTGDQTARVQALQNFAGDNSWFGNDPAVSAIPKSAISQKVLQSLPEDPVVIDSTHLEVPVLVEIQVGSVTHPTWIQLNVPVGHDSSGLDIYASPTVVAPFGAPGTVADKTWNGSEASADIDTQIEATLNEFLPLYYSSSDSSSLATFVISGQTISPESGLVKFDQVQNVTAYGGAKGPWDVVTDVEVTDPITHIEYLQELTIGVVLQDGHYLITGILSN